MAGQCVYIKSACLCSAIFEKIPMFKDNIRIIGAFRRKSRGYKQLAASQGFVGSFKLKRIPKSVKRFSEQDTRKTKWQSISYWFNQNRKCSCRILKNYFRNMCIPYDAA